MSLFKKKVKPIKQDCHYMSNDNGLLVILDLLETRPCYDSTWRVEVHKNGKMVANATIVRQIEETQRNLDNEIRKISEITQESILALDEKSKIYYDWRWRIWVCLSLV